MGSLSYYLMESKVNNSFYGRIKSQHSVDQDEFIETLHLLSPELDINQSELYLKAIFSTMNHLLSEGKSINISGYLKASTIMKGRFKSTDEQFNDRNHSITVNFTPAQSFLTELRKSVTLERVARPVKAPDITMIRDQAGNENCLRLEEANRITGANLIPNDCTLAGIELTNGIKGEERVFIPLKELVLCSHTAKEIIFTFRHSFSPPDWLEKGEAISVKLRYTEEREGIYRDCMPVDSVWAG